MLKGSKSLGLNSGGFVEVTYTVLTSQTSGLHPSFVVSGSGFRVRILRRPTLGGSF